ncbi:MAG: zinc ribbon domain-containing protein [Candidatus Eisenbacteria bacterium]
MSGVLSPSVRQLSLMSRSVYRCSNRLRRYPLPKNCHASCARADQLESAVWDKLTEAIRNPNLIAKHVDSLRERTRSTADGLLQEIKSTDKAIAKVGEEEDRLLDAYTAKVITLDQLKAKNNKIRAKTQHLENRRSDLLGQLENQKTGDPHPDSVKQVCSKVAKGLKAIQDDFEARRELVNLLVTEIVIEGRKVKIRGAIPSTFPPRETTLCGIAPPLSG